LQHHPNKSWFFSDLEQSWNALKNSYTNDFGTLVIGKLTPEATILESLTKIKKRMEHISWTIKLT
jgi:ferric iron reductase protein FhuF